MCVGIDEIGFRTPASHSGHNTFRTKPTARTGYREGPGAKSVHLCMHEGLFLAPLTSVERNFLSFCPFSGLAVVVEGAHAREGKNQVQETGNRTRDEEISVGNNYNHKSVRDFSPPSAPFAILQKWHRHAMQQPAVHMVEQVETEISQTGCSFLFFLLCRPET